MELLELALEELGAIIDVKQEADTESVLGTTEERVCRSRSGFLTTVLLFQLLTLVYFTTQLVTPTTCLSCLHLPHV